MHFAAWLSVPDSVRDPGGYYRNNVVGTLATLEAMAAEGCRHFVFSSTCAVYGEPIETPLSETHPTAPINAYGQTKLAVEHALPHFERAYSMTSIRLRYFNAAGADPDGELGEDHSPEIHVIPRASRPLRLAVRSRSSGRITRHPTGPACATIFMSPIWRMPTFGRSLGSRRAERLPPITSAPSVPRQ
jgi:UDP-glucose 4-epimerase